MDPIQCYMLEPTQRERLYLRRYTTGTYNCSLPHKYHNAMAFLREEPREGRFGKACTTSLSTADKADPNWPQTCDCGNYTFTDQDMWQHFYLHVYRRDDTGEEVTLDDAPPGAIWNAFWMLEGKGLSPGGLYCGPDGLCLVIKTPGGEWMIDGPASNGPRDKPGWTRTGTPPNLTATPSILCGDFHGWLRDGRIVAC
jgi:hypothetical protein